MRKMIPLWGIMGLILALAACHFSAETPTPQPSPTPSATPTASSTPRPFILPPATETPIVPDTGWQPVSPGIETRSLNTIPSGDGTIDRITILRLEASAAKFRMAYAPNNPVSVRVWAQQNPEALLAINAGYFTPENTITGLLIKDGERFGESYGDYAGMLTVDNAGIPSLRWLRSWPFDPNEPLWQAVQSFPVLVKPGGVMGIPDEAPYQTSARRTIIARDFSGRFLLMVSERGIGLHALAAWLTASDLGVDIALNLDGGPSSGLWMSSGPVQVDSLVMIPAVILVMK